VDLRVVGGWFVKLVDVEQQLCPVKDRDLIFVVHLDGIKRTKLGAITTRHTDRSIYVKLFRLRLWPSRLRIPTAYNPDALRRANLGTDTTGGATRIVRLGIPDQERDITKVLRYRQLLKGILYRERPLGLRPLALQQ
jgi:hypothetical protein